MGLDFLTEVDSLVFLGLKESLDNGGRPTLGEPVRLLFLAPSDVLGPTETDSVLLGQLPSLLTLVLFCFSDLVSVRLRRVFSSFGLTVYLVELVLLSLTE